ncbi:24771_t:CDS:2 [Cetraspora pellucida]|uniref:24771_t:CDS:1 n=1 Tax=Cetraspora pellucida TaxID=1433469 RepID=A0A9N9D7C4_9GLOM|nr:24771_t:CDS:2 [Cetraspora pellucida]
MNKKILGPNSLGHNLNHGSNCGFSSHESSNISRALTNTIGRLIQANSFKATPAIHDRLLAYGTFFTINQMFNDFIISRSPRF